MPAEVWPPPRSTAGDYSTTYEATATYRYTTKPGLRTRLRHRFGADNSAFQQRVYLHSVPHRSLRRCGVRRSGEVPPTRLKRLALGMLSSLAFALVFGGVSLCSCSARAMPQESRRERCSHSVPVRAFAARAEGHDDRGSSRPPVLRVGFAVLWNSLPGLLSCRANRDATASRRRACSRRRLFASRHGSPRLSPIETLQDSDVDAPAPAHRARRTARGTIRVEPKGRRHDFRLDLESSEARRSGKNRKTRSICVHKEWRVPRINAISSTFTSIPVEGGASVSAHEMED